MNVYRSKSPTTDQAIDYFSLSHPLRQSVSIISLRARTVMFQRFMQTMRPSRHHSVLDVGITPDQSLPDSNFFETLYPYKEQLVTTSIEKADFITKTFPGIQFVQTSKYSLPFKDNAFDILFCSAVLEHVGPRACQTKFLQELMRVSKRFFITTPNRHFPVEVHTFLPICHWLPQPLHQAILKRMGKKFWAETDNLNLLTTSTLKSLFPSDTNITIDHHHLIGFPTNIIAYGYFPNF